MGDGGGGCHFECTVDRLGLTLVTGGGRTGKVAGKEGRGNIGPCFTVHSEALGDGLFSDSRKTTYGSISLWTGAKTRGPLRLSNNESGALHSDACQCSKQRQTKLAPRLGNKMRKLGRYSLSDHFSGKLAFCKHHFVSPCLSVSPFSSPL